MREVFSTETTPRDMLSLPVRRRLHEVGAFEQGLETDVVVIGAGVAGLSVALEIAKRDAVGVTVVTKGRAADFGGGSTRWAQGGIAAAVGRDDAADLHITDTLKVGRDLCDAEVVEQLVRGAEDAIGELASVGARFDRGLDGQLELGREAGHSRDRILHAGGDATGREVARVLWERVHAEPKIRVLCELEVVDLLLDASGVVGLWGLRRGTPYAVLSRATVLATGGIGQLYLKTTNPSDVAGDGLAMAARAGARLADLELVQFHPTALDLPAVDASGARNAAQLPLLTEALRGAGAHVVDATGERFLSRGHEAGELAPRDVVARAIFRHAHDGHEVFLDLRPLLARWGREGFEERFPTAARTCRNAGLSPTEPLPITPAAHFHMGGVLADSKGRTNLTGLWVCGEAARSGVHGANRLASNSLLEGLVLGPHVGRNVVEALAACDATREGTLIRSATGPDESTLDVKGRMKRSAERFTRELQEILWQSAGLERSRVGLSSGLARVGELEELVAESGRTLCAALRNRLLLTRLILESALRRTESRGAHQRSDFPETDELWKRPNIAPRPTSSLEPASRERRQA